MNRPACRQGSVPYQTPTPEHGSSGGFLFIPNAEITDQGVWMILRVQEGVLEGGIVHPLPYETFHAEATGLCRDHHLIQGDVLQQGVRLRKTRRAEEQDCACLQDVFPAGGPKITGPHDQCLRVGPKLE